MTRLRAKHPHQKVTARVRAHDEFDMPRTTNEPDPLNFSTKLIRAPLERTKCHSQLPTEPRAILHGGQLQVDTIFQATHFAQNPNVRKPLPPNGERYPLVGGT